MTRSFRAAEVSIKSGKGPLHLLFLDQIQKRLLHFLACAEIIFAHILVSGGSNIRQVWLLWGDVVYLLCCCHRKNFAVLLWFCDNCFQWEKLIAYKSNLVIFRYDLATQLIFYNKFSQRGNIARSYILTTSTSNEPVIGRWKRTENKIWYFCWRICAKLSQFPIEFASRSYRRCAGRATRKRPCLYIWIGCRLNHKAVVESQTKPPTTIDLYMNSFTQERRREPRKCHQLALPMTNLLEHQIKTTALKLNKANAPS